MNREHTGSIKLSFPAAAGEIGPGLSSFGMALGLRNHFSFEIGVSSDAVKCTGDFASSVATGPDNLAWQTFRASYHKITGEMPEGLVINCEANIPVNRGLGSSATAILAGLYAGSVLGGRTLDQHELLSMAAGWDGGYADVVPSFIGKFTLSCHEDMHFAQLPVLEGVEILVAVPEIEFDSREFRTSVSEHVTLGTARLNIARNAMVAAALLSYDQELFFRSFQDEILQPRWRRMVTGLQEVMLSLSSSKVPAMAVSGVSLLVFLRAHDNAQVIQRKIDNVFRRKGVATRHFRLRPSETGLIEGH